MIIAILMGVMVNVSKKQLFRVLRANFSEVPKSFIIFCCGFFLHLSPSVAEFGSIVDIGLGGDFYFTDESDNNGQGFINLLIQNTWSNSQLWVDVGAGGLVGEKASSYVKAPQLFYRMGQMGKTHFTIGRALYDWSFADSFWNLGLTQPIFKWNEARPEQQGLTGLFLNFPVVKNYFDLTFFASPLFLPTQGPSFDLSNGRLTSSNPWFNEPVGIINLAGEKAKLNYDIDVPNSQDVVVQTSFGVLFGTPHNKKDFILSGFAMSKPRNDLVLPFQGVLNLTTFNGDITVLPQVAMHQVMGLDIGWNFENVKTVFSWIHEGQVEYDLPVSATYPVLPDQNIFSTTQLFRLSNTQRLWVGYIRVDRPQTQLGGVFANAQISTFQNRNRFDETLRVKWEGLLFKSKSVYLVNASFAANQNLQNDNIWLSSDIRWSLYKGIELFSQCDFFGGSDEFIIGSDFINTYQNNDRCFFGGHYAF